MAKFILSIPILVGLTFPSPVFSSPEKKAKIYKATKDFYTCKDVEQDSVSMPTPQTVAESEKVLKILEGHLKDSARCCPKFVKGEKEKAFTPPEKCTNSQGEKITQEGKKPELIQDLSCRVMVRDIGATEHRWVEGNYFVCNAVVDTAIQTSQVTSGKDVEKILEANKSLMSSLISYHCASSSPETLYGNRMYTAQDSLIMHDLETKGLYVLKYVDVADAEAGHGKTLIFCDLGSKVDEDKFKKLISEPMTATQAEELGVGCAPKKNPIELTQGGKTSAKINMTAPEKGNAHYTINGVEDKENFPEGSGFPRAVDVSWKDGASPTMTVSCEEKATHVAFGKAATPGSGGGVPSGTRSGPVGPGGGGPVQRVD